ncbi:DnaA N-terminal domain-containing protein [Sulfitobacter sp.]|uniref:DnaA N-terminal domain-containing protein n=1 Tax=Sulfitobacter sp. TaxID=1903071 RepID=UPI003F6AADF6
MNPMRLTGPEASVIKYDLLTALSVAGLNGSPTLQTTLMRLIAAVTARYNWRADELTVGQRDLARMWSVNERTVKREIKRLLDGKILICKRGGVRGRVAAYQLNYDEIAKLSEPCWCLVGPDFDLRMKGRYQGQSTVKIVQLSDYTKPAETEDAAVQSAPGTWQRAMARLAKENADQFNAWFSQLKYTSFDQGILRLRAPSKFAQRYIETHLMRPLVSAVEAELGPITRIEFEA